MDYKAWMEDMLKAIKRTVQLQEAHELQVSDLIRSCKGFRISSGPRTPYRHVLNAEGSACSPDCPACAWVDKQEAEKTELTWEGHSS